MSLSDNVGCYKEDLIKTADGSYFNLANPTPESVSLTTIAAALSKLCRYGGHCKRFYSVAEHCVHAANLALSSGVHPDGVKAVLLHDASEAYAGDVVKPLKRMLSVYLETEDRITNIIGEAFGVDFDKWEDTVKKFDRIMLKSEKAKMWDYCPEEWAGLEGVKEAKISFGFWLPLEGEERFLAAAENVGLVKRRQRQESLV